ncbi:Acyl-CoA sterol acyl transferase 1 [Heracleum sosnowskyi]|uniref:Acyl-CoA sterol acyl transferase 1 n=1 Tax=Heracleum sosnowskyi TaxID=360622 RepID=A0AAD8MQN4_9APIA|nr:Acyl-CoA sterol acyl transferase 1 [Heracleum sosnowskyi]
MEGEVNNFAMVWIIVLASLCYCHTIAKFIPKGTTRFLTILPISILFTILPLNLTTMHLGATSSFLIAWLANFKILLFAFDKGPLASNPPIPLSLFIPLACLPIKIHYHSNKEIFEKNPSHQIGKNNYILVNYGLKILVLGFLIKLYDYKELLHTNFILLVYSIHMYLGLELLLAMFANLARILMQVELEPQFNEPYLATSLQDFWGKRWNLMVSNILKPTVFEPTRSISTGLVGRKLAVFPGLLATFFVSGLMHELVFYNYGRQRTRWEVLWFFLIHGLSLCIEMGLKKAENGKFRLPPMVSGPLTVMYVVTSFWLFFPPFLRGNADVKTCTEFLAFVEFVWNGRLVSPNDMSCPYL